MYTREDFLLETTGQAADGTERSCQQQQQQPLDIHVGETPGAAAGAADRAAADSAGVEVQEAQAHTLTNRPSSSGEQAGRHPAALPAPTAGPQQQQDSGSGEAAEQGSMAVQQQQQPDPQHPAGAAAPAASQPRDEALAARMQGLLAEEGLDAMIGEA